MMAPRQVPEVKSADNGVWLGFDPTGTKPIRWRGRKKGHIVLCGATGEGKGASILIPALIDLIKQERWSVIMVSPKAAECAMLYRLAIENSRTIVISPFEHSLPFQVPQSDGCNMLAAIDPENPEFMLWCERIAGIISEDGITTSTNENAAHFKERARALIASLIAEVCENAIYGEDRHLGIVRNIITSSNGEDLQTFCNMAVARGNPLIRQKLESFTKPGAFDPANREVQDVISTAIRFTDFIGNDCIGPNLSKDSIRPGSVKDRKTTVFVNMAAKQLANASATKWLRLLLDYFLDDLWSTVPGKQNVAFIMDEFCSYGALQSVRTAFNLARGFGLVLWVIVQGLSDLELIYGKGAESFINSAAVKITLASDCNSTRETFSKLSGLKTVKVPNYSSGKSTPGIGWPPKMPVASVSEGISLGEQMVPVVQPHDVGNIPADEFLMRIRGVPNIIRGKRKNYWQMSELDGTYDPDPYETGE